MSARERRAEVEALIAVVHPEPGLLGHNCDFEKCQIGSCPTLRAILGHARDARGDESHTKACIQGEIDSECPCEAARSPQGEDHEALVECVDPTNCPQEHVFAHPSPSRDGTVAVEDVAEFIERYPERWGHGPSRLAADIRGHFGSASTTDQHRGENDRSLREN